MTVSKINEGIKINSFEEYIQTINKHYHDNIKTELWYRGQSNKRWRLTPGLYRDSRLANTGTGIQRLRWEYADYKKALNEFSNLDNVKNYKFEGLNNVDELLLAQHFGLITPLLDWTLNPLIALYFAIENCSETNDAAVYILDPGECNLSNTLYYKNDERKKHIDESLDISKFGYEFISDTLDDLDNMNTYIPYCFYNSKDYSFRITRQSGRFTLHSPLNLDYPWESSILSIPEDPSKKATKKLIIDRKKIPEMRKILASLYINKKSVYGNYNSDLDVSTKNIRKKIKDEFNNSVLEK